MPTHTPTALTAATFAIVVICAVACRQFSGRGPWQDAGLTNGSVSTEHGQSQVANGSVSAEHGQSRVARLFTSPHGNATSTSSRRGIVTAPPWTRPRLPKLTSWKQACKPVRRMAARDWPSGQRRISALSKFFDNTSVQERAVTARMALSHAAAQVQQDLQARGVLCADGGNGEDSGPTAHCNVSIDQLSFRLTICLPQLHGVKVC